MRSGDCVVGELFVASEDVYICDICECDHIGVLRLLCHSRQFLAIVSPFGFSVRTIYDGRVLGVHFVVESWCRTSKFLGSREGICRRVSVEILSWSSDVFMWSSRGARIIFRRARIRFRVFRLLTGIII